MELLIRSFGSSDDTINYPRISFQQYLNQFGPGTYLHKGKGNQSILSELIRDRSIVLSDIFASQIASLFAAGALKNGFEKQALLCCRDILRDQGFRDIKLDKLTDYLPNLEQIIVTVVGCQSRELLERRVKATVRVCEPLMKAGRRTRVYFSGGRPPNRARVSIPNEAREMELIFDREITRRRLKQLSKILQEKGIESHSRKTSDNIREIARQVKLQPDESYHFVLVSSSFHIPRLYAEFKEQVLESSTNDKNEHAQIKSVVLVGAEGFLSPRPRSPYQAHEVKYLMFEIFRYFMNNQEFREHLGLARKAR